MQECAELRMCTGGELCAGVKACSGVCRTKDVYRRAVGRGEGWRKAGIGIRLVLMS